MKAEITISLEKFEASTPVPPSLEISRILRELAEHFDASTMFPSPFTIRDCLGNDVGILNVRA